MILQTRFAVGVKVWLLVLQVISRSENRVLLLVAIFRGVCVESLVSIQSILSS